MNEWPTTRDTLLLKLADENNQSAWHEFSRAYEPAIYRFSRRRGLQHADAIELTQRVMLKVLRSADKWAESQPPDRFRAWLRTVAQNTLVNLVTRDGNRRACGEPGAEDARSMANESSESDDRERWHAEERRAWLRLALNTIQPEFSSGSWEAFERTVLSDEPVEFVARDLNITAGGIYAARARVVKRLRSVLRQLREADQ